MRIELSNDRRDRPSDPVKERVGVFAKIDEKDLSEAEAKRIARPVVPAPAAKKASKAWRAKDLFASLTRFYKK